MRDAKSNFPFWKSRLISMAQPKILLFFVPLYAKIFMLQLASNNVNNPASNAWIQFLQLLSCVTFAFRAKLFVLSSLSAFA